MMMALGVVKDRSWKARDYVRSKLSLRHENSGTFKLLGRTIIHRPNLGEIEVRQYEYIKELKQIYIPAARRRNGESTLQPEELHRVQIYCAAVDMAGQGYDAT